jgi:hypothetical protein
MAEHGDAAEQVDEQTPPDEGTDVDEHDTDADLAENAEMPAPQRVSDTRALITVGFVILGALAVWGLARIPRLPGPRGASAAQSIDWPTRGQRLAAMSADLAANIR